MLEPCVRPDWFVHENVRRYPKNFIEQPFEKANYAYEETSISPQRFGKPMARQDDEIPDVVSIFRAPMPENTKVIDWH